MEDKVNLSWHQVTTQEANAYLADSIANISGVNVISPTCSIFRIRQEISEILHQQIMCHWHMRKVWKSGDWLTTLLQMWARQTSLSQLASRQNIIQQLVQTALSVGLDGINVDFESLSEDAGPHFLEFLRELSIECHKNNLVVSVDNPVPEDFTSHYDRKEQGLVVD